GAPMASHPAALAAPPRTRQGIRRDRTHRHQLGRLGLPATPLLRGSARGTRRRAAHQLRDPRPHDDADGAFQIDAWKWLSPFLWAGPSAIFNLMSEQAYNQYRDANRQFINELNTIIQRARDAYFAQEIAPPRRRADRAPDAVRV